MGERNVFAQAGNCWAQRARDPPAKKTSRGRKAAGAKRPPGGQEGGLWGTNAGCVPAPGRCTRPTAGPAARPAASTPKPELGRGSPLLCAGRHGAERQPKRGSSSSSSLGLALPRYSKNHPAHQPHTPLSPIPGVLAQARAVTRAWSCRALPCTTLNLTQSDDQVT